MPGRVDRVQANHQCGKFEQETGVTYVWMVIVGFVVGLVARAVLPGTQSIGLLLTAVLGVAGSFVAGFIGQALGWYQAGQGAGFVGSVLGAMLVLYLYTRFVGGSGGNSPS
jgi:uncharacterized membrane protein YeaQ/YmgE (transglycosylase-associated protein family)